jgi:hypothetical protein
MIKNLLKMYPLGNFFRELPAQERANCNWRPTSAHSLDSRGNPAAGALSWPKRAGRSSLPFFAAATTHAFTLPAYATSAATAVPLVPLHSDYDSLT